MLALIVPVTLEKLPAINEKYDMAKAFKDRAAGRLRRGAPEYIGGKRCPDADGLCKA